MLSGDKMIVEYSFGKTRAFLGVRFVCSYRTGQEEMSATIPCLLVIWLDYLKCLFT